MDSATPYGTSTERYLTPVSSVELDLPPFDWDKRIIWAFERGLARRRSSNPDFVEFLRTIETFGGGEKFTAGCALGFGIGCKQAITDYIQFVANTLRLFGSYLEKAKLAFDPVLWSDSIAIYLTNNGPERAALLEKLATYFDNNYPELAQTLRDLRLVDMALDSLVEWLNTPDAVGEIAVEVSGVLGEVLGLIIDGIKPYVTDPEKLGRGVGYLIGQFVMWVVFDLLGFPYSAALEMLERVIENAAVP
jgi:hypothetical protein